MIQFLYYYNIFGLILRVSGLDEGDKLRKIIKLHFLPSLEFFHFSNKLLESLSTLLRGGLVQF